MVFSTCTDGYEDLRAGTDLENVRQQVVIDITNLRLNRLFGAYHS